MARIGVRDQAVRTLVARLAVGAVAGIGLDWLGERFLMGGFEPLPVLPVVVALAVGWMVRNSNRPVLLGLIVAAAAIGAPLLVRPELGGMVLAAKLWELGIATGLIAFWHGPMRNVRVP